MKKIIALALCLVMALAATACGSTEEAAAPAEEVATEEVAVEETATEEEVAEGEMVSDETWAQLQDLYASLVEARNATVELYNDETVAADADIEEALNTADELITEIGELTQDQISEEQVEDLINAITSVNDIFAAAIDAMQPAA